MNIRIEPRKTTDRGGCIVMPLVENLPYPKAGGSWKRANCPKCGAECWDRELPTGFTENMFEGKLCTKCALRMATLKKSKMTTARAKLLIANMAEAIRASRNDIYDREFADYLIKNTGITPEELVECGIYGEEELSND